MMKQVYILLLFCIATRSQLIVQQCEKDFFQTTFNIGRSKINVFLIWFPTSAGTLTTLSVCSDQTGLPLQRHCEYDRSNNASKWEEMDRTTGLVNCSSIANQCKAEPFEHYYLMRNGLIQPVENIWKSAKLMERADLEKPCLLSSGLPITRLCKFNPQQLAAEWELLDPGIRNISCLRQTREKVITYDLNNLYQKVKEDKEQNVLQTREAMKNMTILLKTTKTVRVPADIKISSDILKIITDDNNPELISDVLNATDIIMGSDPQTVAKAEAVNAPTSLLRTVDKYFQSIAKKVVPTNNCHNITDGIVYKTAENSSIFYINPSCSNISGVVIYKNILKHFNHAQRFDIHTGHRYRFIYMNQSLDQILSEPDVRLASYFPISLWNKLKTGTGGVDGETVLTFTVFRNDLLFVNRTETKYKPIRKVLEISIPDYTGALPEDIPFILSYNRRSRKKPNCGYWNSINSVWLTDGVQTADNNVSNNNLLICHSTHLTHFAALLGISSFPRVSSEDSILLNPIHDVVLDYISILGCGLSLVGVSCIWVTALCFQTWRTQESNKVLLNMCFVLTLLMIFFLFLNLPQLWKGFIDMMNPVHCMLLGGFLHYNVLVLFLWMLIIAIMQYQRYVKVMGYDRSSNFITKYALLAWGIPLIPTLVVAYNNPHTYLPDAGRVENNTAICYPSGNSLYYGVILPIASIMLTNLIIFICIFFSLRRSLCQFKHEGDRERIILQVRISVLLFFLLGISWIFGLLSHLDTTLVFSYLFCLTSTLQGFVLFLYSIVIDKTTRTSWIILCCARNYDTMESTSVVTRLTSKSL